MSDRFKNLFDRLQAMQTKADTVGLSQSTGLTNINLEPVAKQLYPVITPFRNMIPRVDVGAKGDVQASWKALVSIDDQNVPSGLREGRRGGYIAQNVQPYSVAYATLGKEDFVTEQAIMAAQGFDNAMAVASLSLLNAVMIDEERQMLGGNQNYPIGTTPTPTGAVATVAGSSLPAGTLIAKCVALTLDGYKRANDNSQVVQTVTRTNGDGTSDVVNAGSAIISAASTGVTVPANGAATFTVASVPQAFGYAWFVGTASGSLVYAGTSSINTFTISAPATGTQTDSQLTNTDYSANPLTFNGLSTYATVGGGAYYSANGKTLTADGSGGIVEIDAFLAAFYQSRKVTPTAMWVSVFDKQNIKKKILQGAGGSGASAFRINLTDGNRGIVGGSDVSEYLNASAPDGTSVALPIKVHPNLPQGKILFDCDNSPYFGASVPVARRMILRRDYWQVNWPQVTMNRQFGVYYDGAMQVYTPFALGMMADIGQG